MSASLTADASIESTMILPYEYTRERINFVSMVYISLITEHPYLELVALAQYALILELLELTRNGRVDRL